MKERDHKPQSPMIRARTYQIFPPFLIFAALLASCFVAVAEPGSTTRTERAAVEVDPDSPNEGKTGFYAMLSPEVGGGHMVDYRLGEVKYLSVRPILEVRDIKISSISGYSVVRIAIDPGSRKMLQENQELPVPSIHAVDYMEDGRIVWSRSVDEILADNWIIVRIFETKREAESLAQQLRSADGISSAKHEPTHESREPTNAEQGGAPQSATCSEPVSEGGDKPQIESKPRPR